MLQQAIRICALQGIQVVLAVDDCHNLAESCSKEILERLCRLGEIEAGTVTVLLVDCDGRSEYGFPDRRWALEARVTRLTRSEAESYLTAKLAEAGCTDPLFTPRAVTRLHALADCIPRGLNRLATLSLMAGASKRLEAISLETVEAVAAESHVPPQSIFRGRYEAS
jgi:type II secretory pathway predicted ATPase ExeA